MDDKLEKLLELAFELKASDLHITAGFPPVYRINGELKKQKLENLSPQDIERMAKSILSTEQWELLQLKKELDFSFGIPGITRFRANAYHQRSCIGMAIRLIQTTIPTLEELRVPPIFKKFMTKSQGLILVTGPTGSGKSTTVASMIQYMNQNMKKHIITLEDPVEYLHKHGSSMVNQREIGVDTKSFAEGLRAALRQDPDVILVGELRDFETISTAITASETGHLVLGTLHTTDAPSTIDRLIDVFPPNQQTQIRIQLASFLVAILSQRLFPTLDRKGRRVATEVLINNSAVANLIRNEKIHQITNIMVTSRSQGMHTLDMSMLELVQKQMVLREDVQPYMKEMIP